VLANSARDAPLFDRGSRESVPILRPQLNPRYGYYKLERPFCTIVGGVISPILANIYLDRLDQYVNNTLLPQFNRGLERAVHTVHKKYTGAIHRAKKAGEKELYRTLVKERRNVPYGNPNDPDYRRLRYVRYADDFLLGFAGPRAEAEDIKRLLKGFLEDELKLELSSEKTLITHAQTDTARFLGYQIRAWTANDKISANGKRDVNGVIGLYVPNDVRLKACQQYTRMGKPIHRPEFINDSDYSIMMNCQLKYRGLVQYYMLATNVSSLHYVHYIMRVSLLKTLALKHKTKATSILRRYSTTVETAYGTLSCLKVEVPREGKPPLVATFGGVPLRRKRNVSLKDTLTTYHHWRNTDIVKRLLADTCELCGSKLNCQVHHIRKLSDLHRTGRREKPNWMKRMIALKRKTLVVCLKCHHDIHAGRPLTRIKTGEPDAVKAASPVRRGADGKVSYRQLASSLPYLFSSRADLDLQATINHYDRRAGMEADLKAVKQGLGLAVIRKHRLAAQELVVLLTGLVHNVLIWSRAWLHEPVPRLRHCGMVRLVQEVWAVPGRVKLVDGVMVRIRLRRQHPRARALLTTLTPLLAPRQSLAFWG
jgi:Type II intron maturase/Reverse transcriptase (RNA-dependent DNA polymerase)